MKENTSSNNILEAAEIKVKAYLAEQLPNQYSFHDIHHTQNVVNTSRLLAKEYQLSASDLEDILISAWFHDTGYTLGPIDHEIRSAGMAEDFMKSNNMDATRITHVKECIAATKIPQSPKDLCAQILCDADLCHLGIPELLPRNKLLREELTNTGFPMNKLKWKEFQLNFISKHNYHTNVAKRLFEPTKQVYLSSLKDYIQRNSGKEVEPASEFDTKKLSRATETVFKNTYDIHLNLNSLADSKAGTMLSVNSIIFSVVVSFLVPKLEDWRLILPTVVLLSSSVLSVWFAILTIKPKLIKGDLSLDDVKAKKADLLFFGNYTTISLENYQWAMRQMILDPQYIYDSMTRTIYFLGQVLNKKYKFLTYCYTIFLYGIVLSVILFAVCLLCFPK